MYQVNKLKGMSIVDFMELLKKQTDKSKIVFLLRAYREVNKERLEYISHI